MAKQKQYLTGVDWFIRALDCRTRKATGTGNHSQVVLVLKGALDPDVLRRNVAALVNANPILAGRCRRNPLNLAPYWSLPRRVAVSALHIEERPPAGTESLRDILDALASDVNRPLAGPLRVAFTLSRHHDHTYLAMRFDHQILDAIGAERLLMYLAQPDPSAMPIPLGIRPAHLNRWREKFESGRTVNREVIALQGDRPPAAIPLPDARTGKGRRTRFVFRTFSAAETAAIHSCAERSTGYLLLLPFLLGVSVRSLHALLDRLGLQGGDYVIPVSVDSRSAGSKEPALFFNHLSFNFYRFRAADAVDPTVLWREAVQQMYDQVQKHIAHHVANAGMLMRILPAAWLARWMALPLGGRLGSMSFALVGTNGFTAPTFMGLPVEHTFHMPRVPTPPGLGVFFTRYQDRLNLVFSYLDGMMDESMAARFVADVDAELTGRK